MRRLLLAAGLLLVGFDAAATNPPAGGANVRFEQLPSSLKLVATIYRNDGDRVIETGEVLATQTYTPPQDGGIPLKKFTIVTVCAYDFPSVQACLSSQVAPTLPRFNVNKPDGIGIRSVADGTTTRNKRINGVTTTGASSERMSLQFNCTDALCGSKITSARLVLNYIDGTPRTVFLYPMLNGVVAANPIVIKPGGTMCSGIPATFSGGNSTINLTAAALASLPPFNGFQLGSGSANLKFTFRSADVTFGPDQPDFVNFGCRIDLAQTNVSPAFQLVLRAGASEKFCPPASSNVLKLRCAGRIPDYTGGTVSCDQSSTNPACIVECLVAGSQCGIEGVLPAVVRSIAIAPDGTASLVCEAVVN